MTKQEKQNYLNKKSIGYWNVCGSTVELKCIDYDTNIYVVIVVNSIGNKKSIYRVKIYYDIRDYIIIHGFRLFFDECIRM